MLPHLPDQTPPQITRSGDFQIADLSSRRFIASLLVRPSCDGRSVGGRFVNRPSLKLPLPWPTHQLATAIRADCLHRRSALRTKRALKRADAGFAYCLKRLPASLILTRIVRARVSSRPYCPRSISSQV